MNFKINFQKAKRNYMVLTFDDEREKDGKIEEYERKIYVGMPKKRIFTALMDIQEVVNKRNEAESEREKNEADRETIDELYELTAQILSNNLKGEKITVDWVDDQFTIEEIKEFLTQYAKFTKGEASNPN
ncbi:hypothetical protein D7V94_01755 [Parablautia intestinalis]|uniref:Tail assembly chaperone n=1 Tax=Parablautia intestinalis TaxID=2320100 RepID=A0A3A9B675_9FIRM|nr:hypothetical protein [Parablautia intestinalis]RKI94295.1 hypothetical protein D7V94_01755 [Parablautia intestinalis]